MLLRIIPAIVLAGTLAYLFPQSVLAVIAALIIVSAWLALSWARHT